MTAYQRLETRFARLGALGEAMSVLGWDNAAIMPEGGAGARQTQLSTLEVVCHELLTDPALGDVFAAADQQNDLDLWQRANLSEMRRAWQHATAVPADLVEALVKASMSCEMIWRKARPANDFAMVKPALSEVVNLTRQTAQAQLRTQTLARL